MLKCYGCGKGFAAGDVAVAWNLVRMLLGEKSGVMGAYAHPNNPENEKDFIHTNASCLDASFSPMVETNFMWDILADQARQQILDEERAVDPEDYPEISYDALLEDPPYCLDCKRKDTVWCHFSKGYVIHNCVVCGKLWDVNEDELYWDTEDYEYYLVEK